MDLYRAARHLDASIATGITYDRYASEIADITTCLLVAQDHAQATDKTLVDQYRSLIQKHQDALYLWTLEIHSGRGDEPRLIQIQQTYGIYGSSTSGSLFVELRNKLWQKTIEDEKKIIPVLVAETN